MSHIKTMAYLDIGATGLISSRRPKVTELSLIAASKECIRELHSKCIKFLKFLKFPKFIFVTEGLSHCEKERNLLALIAPNAMS